MTAAEPVTHIRLDAHGVAWVDDTNVKVIEIIVDQLAYGHGPEENHLQHPQLSLAQVHSAFAYYFDHRPEMETEIERRYQDIEALGANASDQLSRKELLARMNKR